MGNWIGSVKRKRNNDDDDDDEEAMDDDLQLPVTKKPRSTERNNDDGKEAVDDDLLPQQKKPRSTESGWKHQVFLSFRGADTRNGFISHLYDALVRAQINVFIDDDDQKLRKGKSIGPELFDAIDASKYAVVVLSRNYASSKWCLEELARIVQRMGEGKLEVVPVFYKVDPSHVRHQIGSFQKAFTKHQRDGSMSEVQVEGWRDAFSKVGKTAGYHIKEDSNESEEVNKIVQRLDEKLRKVFVGDENRDLVGIKERAEEVIKLLSLDLEDVRFLVIHGMSGSGKTTLAQFVYRKIRNKFEGSSFVLGINDTSVESHNFRELHQEVLRGLFNDRNIHIRDIDDGASLFQRKLGCGSKFLLVLDDVTHYKQVKALAGDGHWYGVGSRVILTTTNRDVLITDRSVEFCDKYECKLLNDRDALTLFCLKAFKTEQPKLEFQILTSQILRHLNGHPLAIEVIGSSLCNEEDVRCWEETEEMLRHCCHEKQILDRLAVGYCRLNDNEKKIFMYLACGFTGLMSLGRKILVRTMKDIGLSPRSGIDILIKRSLVSVYSCTPRGDGDRCYSVHNLLKQMCWKMIEEESPDEPHKRKALNSRQDIQEILLSKKGSQTIRIINDELEYPPVNVLTDGHPKCFLKMTNLVVLKIDHKVEFPKGLSNLPDQLRILHWWCYPLKAFPPTFQPKHLVQLCMPHSRLEKLWENFTELPNLSDIDLSFSENLVEVPDLSRAPRLVELRLSNCSKLVEIHHSVFVHGSLRYVDLSWCSGLESLGCNEIDMKHLEDLRLDECSNLQTIPEFGETTQNLNMLSLSRNRVEKLPESLGRLHSLQYLYADGCPVKELPSSICLLKKLKELSLRRTNLATLPTGIDDSCRSMGTLRLDDCKNLTSLPKLPKSRKSSIVKMHKGKTLHHVDFHYVASEIEFKGYDVPRSGRENFLVISCLNCPGLFENKRGEEDAAVTILKKYLEVGSIFKVIPHASFEILHTSTSSKNKISEWFEYHGNGNTVTMKLPACGSGWCDDTWIGIAICAAFDGHNISEGMDAWIHSDKGSIGIPIPLKFCYSMRKRQLVWYVSVDKYVRQVIDWPQIHELHISFQSSTGRCLKVKSCAARMMYKTDLDEFAHPCRFTETFERVVGGGSDDDEEDSDGSEEEED